METEYSKATEYGNYLSMDNQAFPIDCETLAALQNNTKKLAALGWIAGCNKLILIGCNIAGRERKEGYVFVVSSDNPLTGEVLYYKGGSSSEDKCHISEKTVNVTADGTDFPKAYSIRMLEDGVAGEPMNWADFGNVNEISNLKLFQSIKKEVSDITSVITRAINSEATNRDKAISSAISTEVTNRNSAISNAISAEETNRDKAISSAISSEVTNRNSAISSAISSEVTNRNSAISSAISTEVTNRDKAIETLNTTIKNLRIPTYYNERLEFNFEWPHKPFPDVLYTKKFSSDRNVAIGFLRFYANVKEGSAAPVVTINGIPFTPNKYNTTYSIDNDRAVCITVPMFTAEECKVYIVGNRGGFGTYYANVIIMATWLLF